MSKQIRVAFDCDGTLIDYSDKLRDETCRLLIAFLHAGLNVTVWSGGGKHYAERIWNKVVMKYRLYEVFSDDVHKMVDCRAKDDSNPDIAIDDQHVSLGQFNVYFPPKAEVDGE